MRVSDELTIVIPAKDEERLLPRLLGSLERQDYPLMSTTKVILADADSGDGTVSAAMKFNGRLSIQAIHGGLPSVGRNRGALIADSRYVLFVDADVELSDPTLVRRAVALMRQKSLHCVSTDIFCCGGIWLDHVLYGFTNLAQRLSRFHRPFATGMFMLVDKQEFDRLGGFDEQALYAEDYQLTRRIRRGRFRVLKGGVYTTNRRFAKMGRWTVARCFLSTALHGRKPNTCRKSYYQAYWEAY